MRGSTQVMRKAAPAASPIHYPRQTVVSTTASIATGCSNANAAAKLLTLAFKRINKPVAVRLWEGTTLMLGNASVTETRPSFTLVIRNPNVVTSMILRRDPLYIAEAYFCGDFIAGAQQVYRQTILGFVPGGAVPRFHAR